MELPSVSSSRGVIIVADANRNKKNVDAVEWAFKQVVHPKDVVLVLGVLCELGKHKSYSCFPLMNTMGGRFSGILEKLDLSSGHGEVNPKQVGEEIERKREQYQTNLQPFCRQCKKKEVKMEVKIAAGYCPAKLTVDEAQKYSNIRWIVLDSNLKKHTLYIHERVGCDVAIMKGKDSAEWMPAKSPHRTSPRKYKGAVRYNNQHHEEEEQSSNRPAPLTPPTPYWYPLSWRSGFPRAFALDEIEEMTCALAEDNKLVDTDGAIIYKGIFQESAPVLVQSFLENDDRFWSMMMILSRIRHRNIIKLIGYCCTGTSRFILSDYPNLGTVETNLIDDVSARKFTWRERWYMAKEVGGSLRYLHEECSGGSIVHQSVCSAHIIFTHGGAMLSNFVTAKWIHEKSSADHDQCSNSKKDESLYVDVHDYGVLLLELLSGKISRLFPDQSEGQTLITWALPHLEAGSLDQIIDPRLMNAENESCRLVGYMVKAALLCLKDGASDFVRPSISEVLAVVRGDQLASSRC